MTAAVTHRPDLPPRSMTITVTPAHSLSPTRTCASAHAPDSTRACPLTCTVDLADLDHVELRGGGGGGHWVEPQGGALGGAVRGKGGGGH